MNCVGIDVSKGKSMIAVMRPFGEVVVSPFEVLHTDSELSKLARLLKSLDGETRVDVYKRQVLWVRIWIRGSFSSNQISVVFSCLVSPVLMQAPFHALVTQ